MCRSTSLVEHGVLQKTPYREPAQRTRDAYHPTPAGEEAKVVMVAMRQWGEAHVPQTQGSRVAPVAVDTSERVHARLLDPHGQIIPAVSVTFVRVSTPEAVTP
ncbi:helix-turn-helix domain-containing protein [Streptomyces sp. PT12]|uniref:winged helix-turn-helix transcriptional regulator n=1 Tax=Streptomyces sp. PT12 TaxID=1510197 RepID=UPI000DE5310A|nr:helix-turn-helix transcriptional regulator [Streptomyces sp. PT12]RBM11800.1 hypothetical protein DEH69_21170 [Streptomyces sp. PT12]